MLSDAGRNRLRHMLDAARQVEVFLEGRLRPDLDDDAMLLFAVVRGIEVIGEAASQVTPSGRVSVPQLPWPAIVGMRNRLIHAYFDVDRDRVWDTCVADLPPLIQMLEEALRPGSLGAPQ